MLSSLGTGINQFELKKLATVKKLGSSRSQCKQFLFMKQTQMPQQLL